MMNGFWAVIDAQLKELETAKSADDVIRILGRDDDLGCGDAFFGGSGGDGSVWESLNSAGWTQVWAEAHYYYVMKAPDGSMITYCEGDIYEGDRR